MAKVSGGDKAREALNRLARKLEGAKAVRIGFLENATYPNGTSVPMVAAINEFGAPSRGQPPRPFFRRMIAAKQGEWPAAIRQLLIRNNYGVEVTLEQIGEAVSGQLRQSIVELTDPPLAPSTVKRKGFDKPLIDTGQMLNSVSYEVIK